MYVSVTFLTLCVKSILTKVIIKNDCLWNTDAPTSTKHREQSLCQDIGHFNCKYVIHLEIWKCLGSKLISKLKVHQHLQRVRHANRGRLLLRTPGHVPLWTGKCSDVETNLSWTCLVSGLLSFEHPSVLLFLLQRFATDTVILVPYKETCKQAIWLFDIGQWNARVVVVKPFTCGVMDHQFDHETRNYDFWNLVFPSSRSRYNKYDNATSNSQRIVK